MPCEFTHLPGGVRAIICTRPGRRRRGCSVCGRPASRLCDYPVTRERIHSIRDTGTCDKPLCPTCAVSPNGRIDHCPDHPREQGKLDL